MKNLLLITISTIFLVACEQEELIVVNDQIARRSVQIVNNRDSPMVIFRGSVIKESTFGPDRLGNRIINPGRAITLAFNESSLCLYDFRAEFDDGVEIDERKINICEVSQWVAE